MAKRNPSTIELCFDSMTDLITNLAGGLVLVALLVLGMTHEAKEAYHAAQFSAAEKKKEGGGVKSLVPLERQGQILNNEIAAVEKNLATLDARLPKLQEDVESLVARALSATKK